MNELLLKIMEQQANMINQIFELKTEIEKLKRGTRYENSKLRTDIEEAKQLSKKMYQTIPRDYSDETILEFIKAGWGIPPIKTDNRR